MKKESRFLVQKKIWWGKSKKGASDQTQTMLALRANKGNHTTFDVYTKIQKYSKEPPLQSGKWS